MNAQKYKQILQENLMSSVESLKLPSDYIFQQGNDPKHTAKSTKSGCLKIMLKFCNGQSVPEFKSYGELVSIFEISNRKTSTGNHQKKNGTKYLIIIARSLYKHICRIYTHSVNVYKNFVQAMFEN